MLAPSHENHTGLGCGVPSLVTVTSQPTPSSRSRVAAREPNSVVVSMSESIAGLSHGAAESAGADEDRNNRQDQHDHHAFGHARIPEMPDEHRAGGVDRIGQWVHSGD